MTVATAVVAALILLIATQNPASLWAVAASPIVLLFTAVGLFIANLLGWNRLWTSEWQPEPATADHGARLQLNLRPKNWTRAYGNNPAVESRVRRPGGQVSRHNAFGARAIHGFWWALYPDDFTDPEPLTAGTYTVTWLEEARPDGWREVITHRVTLDSLPPS
jgi:hypothetical protein